MALPFILLIALGQLVFAFNLVQTLRGRVREADDQRFLGDERQLVLVAGVAIAFAAPLFAVAFDRKESVQSPAGGGLALKDPGGQLFVQNCSGCHTLAAAGARGTVGPSLDTLRPNAARVVRAIEKGGTGTGNMPPKLLAGADAQKVAAYVAKAAGKPSP